MRKILLAALLLSVPAQANAGFIMGMIVGGALSSGDSRSVAAATGIPFSCLQYTDEDSYKRCRLPSAYQLEWVAVKPQNCRPGHCVSGEQFVKEEWTALQKLRAEIAQPPTQERVR